MPPVLHVSFDELAGGGPQEVLPRDLAARDRQGHDVLELVAKPVRAPGLIKGRARPYAAGERLVEEPAVEHDVHGAVRRLDLDGADDVVPPSRDRLQRQIEIALSGSE